MYQFEITGDSGPPCDGSKTRKQRAAVTSVSKHSLPSFLLRHHYFSLLSLETPHIKKSIFSSVPYNRTHNTPNEEIEMSASDDYDYSQHATSNTREKYSFLYPTSGSSSRDVEFLDRYRENVSIPPDNCSRHMGEKQAASADNDRAARDREAAGMAGRDWEYDRLDYRHWDSKRHQ
ncbi:hypothetical protein CLAIMM_00500 [Cladophialophora immunda]|nr:hypothetical protein CLAIMM_00500 [Cladophialophora immunda]